jgi:acetyl-CoA synthetase
MSRTDIHKITEDTVFSELREPTIDGVNAVAVPKQLQEGNDGWPKAHINSFKQYREMWEQSIRDSDTFWSKLAHEIIHWYHPFEVVTSGGFEHGDVAWFRGGKLNVSYNCVDRHANADPNRVAMIYEPDEPNQSRHITYGWLFREVNRVANLLRSYGLRKGDAVAIYMPMVPETVVAMLACTRIGCPHTVVFAGFSFEALRDRINNAQCRVIFTVDEGRRGGRVIATKNIVDQAMAHGCPSVEKIVVFQRGAKPADVLMTEGRDEWWHEAVSRHRAYCPPEWMDAEDPLFLLYTSGSTGTPKGVVHTTAGYLLNAAVTTKYAFDFHHGDILGCTADVGWITGHSYIVYGPMCLGGTSLLFESVPTYPNASRYWDMVADHKITHFYTAPTAIRALRRLGDQWLEGKDLSSLRVIGSVGEPINPEAWRWYNEKVGKGRCAVIDTYWQTETGAVAVTPLPGAIPTKPGSASVPFFGIDLAILDPTTGKELTGNDVEGVLAIKRPWPSIMRTVYNTHERYLNGYMRVYPGYYFTGDGCYRDADGYYWIRGRVDDVINVSGHRLSTSEIESALIQHPAVAETAVVGQQDDLTGQAICAFVTIKPTHKVEVHELVLQVRKVIGPFAAPKHIHIVAELPKTRSGKIVRRVLRKIVNGEADSLGDLSTIGEPTVVDDIIRAVAEKQQHT